MFIYVYMYICNIGHLAFKHAWFYFCSKFPQNLNCIISWQLSDLDFPHPLWLKSKLLWKTLDPFAAALRSRFRRMRIWMRAFPLTSQTWSCLGGSAFLLATHGKMFPAQMAFFGRLGYTTNHISQDRFPQIHQLECLALGLPMGCCAVFCPCKVYASATWLGILVYLMIWFLSVFALNMNIYRIPFFCTQMIIWFTWCQHTCYPRTEFSMSWSFDR